MKLIATRPMRYRTRRLQAGEEFEEANDVFARVLVMRKRAQYADKPAAKPAPEPPRPAPPPAEEDNSLDDLREEAERLGVDVDGRWGKVRLQAEIARAKL